MPYPFRTTIRPFLVFLVRFSYSHFHKVLVRYRYRDSLSLSILSGFFDSDPERTTTPVAARPRYDFRGLSPTGFLDQLDVAHSAGFPIILITQKVKRNFSAVSD